MIRGHTAGERGSMEFELLMAKLNCHLPSAVFPRAPDVGWQPGGDTCVCWDFDCPAGVALLIQAHSYEGRGGKKERRRRRKVEEAVGSGNPRGPPPPHTPASAVEWTQDHPESVRGTI